MDCNYRGSQWKFSFRGRGWLIYVAAGLLPPPLSEQDFEIKWCKRCNFVLLVPPRTTSLLSSFHSFLNHFLSSFFSEFWERGGWGQDFIYVAPPLAGLPSIFWQMYPDLFIIISMTQNNSFSWIYKIVVLFSCFGLL